LPQRPKSNTGKVVTITLVSVLAVVGVLTGVLVAIDKKKPNSVADSGYHYEPTPTHAPPVTSAAITPTLPPTTPVTTPTTAPTRTTATTTAPQPVLKSKDNPLFLGENGADPVTCDLPRWQSTPAAAQAYFTAALPCFEAAWVPAMKRANLPYVTPKLVFPSGRRWESGCGVVGDSDAIGFYCSADTAIYLPFNGLRTQTNGSRTGVYLALLAHEFGHHLQAMSGSLKAANREEYDLGADTPAGLEMSRRTELQAQCFSGMWFAAAAGKGSVDGKVIREMTADGYQSGDSGKQDEPRSHGTKKNNGLWQDHGFKTNRTRECNTYLASSASVS